MRAAELSAREVLVALTEARATLHETEATLHERTIAESEARGEVAAARADAERALSELSAARAQTVDTAAVGAQFAGLREELAVARAAALEAATRSQHVAGDLAKLSAAAAAQSSEKETAALRASERAQAEENASTLEALHASVGVWKQSYQQAQRAKRRSVEEAARAQRNEADAAHSAVIDALRAEAGRAAAEHAAAIATLRAQHDAECDVLKVSALGVADAAATAELQRERERLHAGPFFISFVCSVFFCSLIFLLLFAPPTGLGASERLVKTLSREMKEMAAQMKRDAAAHGVARAREVERDAALRGEARGEAEAKMERVLALKLRENTTWQAARLDQRTVSEQRLLVANLVASRERVRSLAKALDALQEPRRGEGGGEAKV